MFEYLKSVLMFWSTWRLKFDRQIKSPSFIIEHAVINFLSAPSAAVKYRSIILQLKGVLYTQNALLCWWLVVRRNGGVRRRLSAGVSCFLLWQKCLDECRRRGMNPVILKNVERGCVPFLDVCLLCPHMITRCFLQSWSLYPDNVMILFVLMK